MKNAHEIYGGGMRDTFLNSVEKKSVKIMLIILMTFIFNTADKSGDRLLNFFFNIEKT